MHIIKSVILIYVLFILCIAQPDESGFSRSERENIIIKIGNLLEKNYVDTQVGHSCRTQLEDYEVKADLLSITHPRSFVHAVNTQLQKIHHDKHIRISFIPPEEQNLNREQPVVSLLLETLEKQTKNFGFDKVEILTDNVGYLNLTSFTPADMCNETLYNVLNYLQFCDALIIDLRDNRGGSLDMVRQFAGYFFSDTTCFSSYYWRRGDYVEEYWTKPDKTLKNFWKIPLFILTSNKTFSAAEDFSYGMQSRKRAILIGEQTGGGANPGFTFSLNHRFNIFIPTGKAINPLTGDNWEKEGLMPDIKVGEKGALNVAIDKAGFAARSWRKLRNDESVNEYRTLVSTLESENLSASDYNSSMDSVLNILFNKKLLDQWTINRLGYHYMRKDNMSPAKNLLLFNINKFPQSANANDSMGEFYYKTGQYNQAEIYYSKSLKIDAHNQNALFMLEKINTFLKEQPR